MCMYARALTLGSIACAVLGVRARVPQIGIAVSMGRGEAVCGVRAHREVESLAAGTALVVSCTRRIAPVQSCSQNSAPHRLVLLCSVLMHWQSMTWLFVDLPRSRK